MTKINKTHKILHKKLIADITKLKIGHTLQEVNNSFKTPIKKNTICIHDNNKYIQKKWWNTEMDKLYRHRNNTRSLYEKLRSTENLNKLTEAQNNLTTEINKQKKANFNQLLDEISNSIISKQIWKSINNIKKYGYNKRINNSWNQEEIQKFLESIAGPNQNHNFSSNPYQNSIDKELPDLTRLVDQIRPERNPDSAKGLDGISY